MIRHSCCSWGSSVSAASSASLVSAASTERLRSLGGRVVRGHVLGGVLQPGAAGLEVVGGEVAGDRHQPGAEVLALPAEGAHAAQRPEEGLRGQVLGERHRADPVVDEAVDRDVVVVVEQPEGLGVAAAGELDQARSAGSPRPRPPRRSTARSASSGRRGSRRRRRGSQRRRPRRAARTRAPAGRRGRGGEGAREPARARVGSSACRSAAAAPSRPRRNSSSRVHIDSLPGRLARRAPVPQVIDQTRRRRCGL